MKPNSHNSDSDYRGGPAIGRAGVRPPNAFGGFRSVLLMKPDQASGLSCFGPSGADWPAVQSSMLAAENPKLHLFGAVAEMNRVLANTTALQRRIERS